MSTLQEIEDAVRKLPDHERLRLADAILRSLPPPPAGAAETDILTEALQRNAALESGSVSSLSEEDFWAGIRRSGP
jgi:hypothetical protein